MQTGFLREFTFWFALLRRGNEIILIYEVLLKKDQIQQKLFNTHRPINICIKHLANKKGMNSQVNDK